MYWVCFPTLIADQWSKHLLHHDAAFVDVMWLCWNLTSETSPFHKSHKLQTWPGTLTDANWQLVWKWPGSQQTQVWHHKNLDLICIMGPTHTLQSAKDSIFCYDIHMLLYSTVLSSKPNQKMTQKSTGSIIQVFCSWTTTLWVQMSNIYIIISIFPAHKAQSALRQSGTSVLLPSCVFTYRKTHDL